MSKTLIVCYNAMRHKQLAMAAPIRHLPQANCEEVNMSKVFNPKAWYLVGIGAAALAVDGLRRLVNRRREEAESAPVASEPPDEHIPFYRSETAAEPKAKPTMKAEPVAAEKAPRAEKPARVTKDDLTEINGIGPTYAKRLSAAGIITFADLAAASPDRLREVTRATAMTNPEEWIAQALVKK